MACPSDTDLLAFHQGRLGAADLRRLEGHLSACPDCEAALERLEPQRDEVLAVCQHLAHPPADAPPLPSEWPSVPGYEIVGELGRGGMGVVYQARQLGLRRTVALKMVLARAHTGARDLARFRAEAEAIARLRHPNIVQVYDVGGAAGRPYFALEYVPGGTLAQQLGGAPQPARPAAELVETLARAIHHAHEHGILHRDLKPANILIQTTEDRGQKTENPGAGLSSVLCPLSSGIPKISDFGLAKCIDGGGAGFGPGDLTATGEVMGTPMYMAPEQADPRLGAVGPHTDVYALGVILYELLAGRPPFRAETPAATLQQVLGEEPVSVSRLRPDAPRDLAVICQRCLEKAPARRYRTAAALADDLGRFLRGEPILARPVGELERLGKWARRRPAVAVLLAAVAVTLAAGSATSTYFAVEAGRRARDAVAARNRSLREVAAVDFQQGQALAERGAVAAGMLRLLAGLRELPDEAEDAPVRRAVETGLAAWAGRLHRLRFLETYPDDVFALAYSPDGRYFAVSTGLTGAIHLYDADTGAPAGGPLEHGHRVRALAFSPDGRVLVSGGDDDLVEKKKRRPPRVRCWDVAAGRALPGPDALAAKVVAIVFRPDGRHFLTADRQSGLVREWETATGRVVDTWDAGGRVDELTLMPDGATALATVRQTPNLTAVLRDGRGPPRRVELGEGERVAPHPDGRTLWVSQSAQGGTVRRWDLAAGRFVGEPIHHPAGARLAVAPDGQTGAVASTWRTEEVRPAALTLRRAATGQFLGRIGQDELYQALAFSPDGSRLLTATDKAVRLWQLADPVPLPEGPPAGPKPRFAEAAYNADRTLWAVATVKGGFARLGRVATGEGLRDFAQGPEVHTWRAGQVALSPDGTRVATLLDGSSTDPHPDGWRVQVWDAATGRPVGPPVRFENTVATLAFSPDSRVLAAGDYDEYVHLLDAATGARLGPPLRQTDIVASLAFSPDGRHLAAGVYRDHHRQRDASLWDLATRTRVGPPLPTDEVPDLLFSPDGGTLVTLTDGAVRCWDVARAAPRGPALPHPRGRTAAAFSPDGRTLATGAGDGTVRLWDAATLTLLPGALLAHPAGVTRLAFSPDGRTLAVATRDRAVRLWDVAGRQPLGPPVAGRTPVIGLAFTPDGAGVVLTTGDGRTRVWPVPSGGPLDPAALHDQLAAATGVALGDGKVVVQLDAAAWRACRDRVDAGGAPGLPLPAPRAEEWHEARYRDAEQDGDAFAAHRHLDALLALRPDDWRLHARRGRLEAAAGRWAAAAAALARAGRTAPPADLLDWYRLCAADARAAGPPRR